MSTVDALELTRRIRADHDVVEAVVGALLRWAREGQEEAPFDRAEFVEFFRSWVGDRHHRLEDLLFQKLVERVDVPADRGPLMVLTKEHDAFREIVDRLAAADPGAATADAAKTLNHQLLVHIDKENSVLLPEASQRLLRHGVVELAADAEDDDERRVRRVAEDLVKVWTPLDDDDLFRSDGCMACAAFCDTCDGIEREWWNAWELAHHRSMQE